MKRNKEVPKVYVISTTCIDCGKVEEFARYTPTQIVHKTIICEDCKRKEKEKEKEENVNKNAISPKNYRP